MVVISERKVKSGFRKKSRISEKSSNRPLVFDIIAVAVENRTQNIARFVPKERHELQIVGLKIFTEGKGAWPLFPQNIAFFVPKGRVAFSRAVSEANPRKQISESGVPKERQRCGMFW
jgi:hypothetical protein